MFCSITACLCVPGKVAVPEMTYTVSGRTLNHTHSLTQSPFCQFAPGIICAVECCMAI